MIRWISIFFVSISLNACLPEPITVSGIPVAEDAIVVSNILVPDQGISLLLTKNFSALSDDLENDSALVQQILLSGAEVSISNNNDTVFLNEVSNGVYGSLDFEQVVGEEYYLEVYDSANDKTVDSRATLMEQVLFSELQVVTEFYGEDTLPHVYFEFEDPPGKNWYMINVQKVENTIDILQEFLTVRTYTYLVDEEAEEENDIITGDFLPFFNDNYNEGDTIIVSLANIEEEYYDYLEKRNNSFFSINLVAEPYNFPTNINGGYGFFSLHLADNRIFIME